MEMQLDIYMQQRVCKKKRMCAYHFNVRMNVRAYERCVHEK